MKNLPWPDEKKARDARAAAVEWLRNCGYSWRQIARAMNSTRYRVQCIYLKQQRAHRKMAKLTLPMIQSTEMKSTPLCFIARKP